MKKLCALVIAIVMAMATVPTLALSEGESYHFEIYMCGSWTGYPEDGGEGYQIMRDAMKAYGLPDITFKVTAISSNEYYTKLNALAVIGQLPDLMAVDTNTLRSFASSGLIVPLEDYLSYMPVASSMMRQSDLDALTLEDGHLYALPTGYLDAPASGANTAGIVLRADWLTQLGLEVPQTLQELENVLTAFVNYDDQGDGQKNLGYVGDFKVLANYVLGAYGIQPTFWMETEDGLALGSTLENTKLAMATLADWYKKGLIDSESMASENGLTNKVTSSMSGIWGGGIFDGNPTNAILAGLLPQYPDVELKAVAAVTGPEGESGYPEVGPGYSNLRAVSSTCENVEVLMQFLNWCTDKGENGGHYLCSVGVENENYQMDPETQKITMLTSYGDIYARGLGNPVRFLQIVDRRWLDERSFDLYYTWENMYRANMFWGTTESMLEYPDTCEELFWRYLYKVVMGDVTVEEGFSEYIEMFESMGGDAITEEVNAAFAAE